MIVFNVDDILLTGSDVDDIKKAKEYLKEQFVTKYMGRPRYSLGIEIAHSKHGVVSSFSTKVCFRFIAGNWITWMQVCKYSYGY